VSAPTDYGVSVTRVSGPGAPTVPPTAFRPLFIGPGARTKRVTEEVVRGGSSSAVTFAAPTAAISAAGAANAAGEQTLTVDASTGLVPGGFVNVRGHVNAVNNGRKRLLGVLSGTSIVVFNPGGLSESTAATLVSDAVAPLGVQAIHTGLSLRVTSNGSTQDVASDLIRFHRAFIQGAFPGTVNFNTPRALGILLDGDEFTVILTHNASPSVTTTARNVFVNATFSSSGNQGTLAEFIAALNLGLVARLGSAYAHAARALTATTWQLMSQRDNSTSRVEIVQPVASSGIGAGLIAAATAHVSFIGLTAASYVSTSTYTARWVARTDTSDPLAQTPLAITRVSLSREGAALRPDVDYLFSGVQVAWTPPTTAEIEGIVAATIDVTPNDQLPLVIDGTAVTIDLNGAGTGILGYANPSDANAMTQAEVVVNVNAWLAAYLGPHYRSAARTASDRLYIASHIVGAQGTIDVLAGSASTSAAAALFGATLPRGVSGIGTLPAQGSSYFVTYEIARPTSEYNVVRLWTRDQRAAALADLGDPSPSNRLAMQADIAFRIGSPVVCTLQVNDAAVLGSPTRSEWEAALEAARANTVAEVTDFALGTSDASIWTLGITLQGRRPTWAGYYGPARNTPVGDAETTGSARALARSLAVPASHPARGNVIFVVPQREAGYTIDTNGVRYALDGWALASAVAAFRGTLGPADSLASRVLPSVFNTDDYTTADLLQQGQTDLLAGSGCLVVFGRNNQLSFELPYTTEGALEGPQERFLIESAGRQQVAVARRLRASALQFIGTVVGTATFSRAAFIIALRGQIVDALNAGADGSEYGRPIVNAATGESRGYSTRDVVIAPVPGSLTRTRVQTWFQAAYPQVQIQIVFDLDVPVGG
jgi:hypothetical protein